MIARLAEEHDAFVITDEVYEHIVYSPFKHSYFASLPGMFERTLSCSSLSKTYSITGWRLGYVIASEEVIQGVRKAHDFLTVGAAAPLQEAAVAALALPDRYYSDLLQGYTARRDVFLDQLEQAGLPFTAPQGAYYVMVDISEFGCPDDTTFCEWMARDVGVAAVPGSSFSTSRYGSTSVSTLQRRSRRCATRVRACCGSVTPGPQGGIPHEQRPTPRTGARGPRPHDAVACPRAPGANHHAEERTGVLFRHGRTSCPRAACLPRPRSWG